MSLFSSIQLAKNTLLATEIGLHVVGNNIANANTPGFIRQEVIYQPSPPQRIGNLSLGLGVEIAGIRQASDHFLEDRLRSANSDLAQASTREQAWLDVEGLVGELSDTNLRTSLTSFFNSIHDVLNQPESIAARNLAVLQGQNLATDFNRLSGEVDFRRGQLNDRIATLAGDINRLTDEIARLNVQIVTIEGTDPSSSDAIGLRDQRVIALSNLSKLIDIRSYEQESGAVTVLAGGDLLVANNTSRKVDVAITREGDLSLVEVQIVDTASRIDSSGGELGGLLAARDEILGGFQAQLDQLAGTLAFEFNRLFSSGQGLVGNSQLTSEHSVSSASVALDRAGLAFTPVNGSFQVLVHDKATGLTTTTVIQVPLHGLDNDATLGSVASALDAVAGISASITDQGKLQITSDVSNLEFAFAEDSSGTLAALGLASFFTGTTAGSLGISQPVRTDPAKFAASSGGIGNDSRQAERLAAFFDTPLESQNGVTFAELYDQMSSDVSQQTATARSVASGFRAFQQTLEGQSLAVSGVSIDEEAIKMLMLQRAYQASAKYIATINELLEALVNL